MFCPRCGKQLVAGTASCGACGTPIAGGAAAVDLTRRPMVVTLLAVLQFISAAFLLFGAAMIGITTTATTDTDQLVAVLFLFGFGSFALLQLVCGVGLWTLKPYGRILQLILAWIGLLAVPLGTIISILILVYFYKPGVKALFSGKPSSELTAEQVQEVAALHQGSGAAIAIIVVVLGVLMIGAIGIVAAIAIPGLLRARVSGNEAATIGSIRALQSAQEVYASANGGFYDTLECLTTPATCLTGYSGPAMLDSSYAQDSRQGYTYRFDPGPAGDAERIRTAGHSPSSIVGFAYVATPVQPGTTGLRTFCGDSTGTICTMPDSVPRLEGGVCPARCEPLR